jgi:GntR family transcriptional regulator, transcriptional repressor for pyruvate dehydrogenase complex
MNQPGSRRGRPPLMKQERLADRVADELLLRIRDGELEPGERLPTEAELCVEFGVSRTVVREATRFLVARGVVEVRAGSGAMVATIDAGSATDSLALFLEGRPESDYVAMHEVREVLEAKGARAAAERATPDDLALLKERHAAMVALAGADDLDALAHADLAFHAAVAAASHNDILTTLLDALGPTLMRPREVNLVDADARTEALDAHAAILTAIQDRDADAAELAMLAHMRHVIDTYNSLAPQPAAG